MSHAPKRRSRGGHEEEHENHERWLVSYADMITVLMALFIVLYAMSQVDETKYEQLKQGLAVGFGREQSILNGAQPATNAGSAYSETTRSGFGPRRSGAGKAALVRGSESRRCLNCHSPGVTAQLRSASFMRLNQASKSSSPARATAFKRSTM